MRVRNNQNKYRIEGRDRVRGESQGPLELLKREQEGREGIFHDGRRECPAFLRVRERKTQQRAKKVGRVRVPGPRGARSPDFDDGCARLPCRAASCRSARGKRTGAARCVGCWRGSSRRQTSLAS